MLQFNYSPKQHNEVDTIIPILKIINTKVREEKWLPQDHTVSDRTQSQSQVCLITEFVLLTAWLDTEFLKLNVTEIQRREGAESLHERETLCLWVLDFECDAADR